MDDLHRLAGVVSRGLPGRPGIGVSRAGPHGAPVPSPCAGGDCKKKPQAPGERFASSREALPMSDVLKERDAMIATLVEEDQPFRRRAPGAVFPAQAQTPGGAMWYQAGKLHHARARQPPRDGIRGRAPTRSPAGPGSTMAWSSSTSGPGETNGQSSRRRSSRRSSAAKFHLTLTAQGQVFTIQGTRPRRHGG